MLLRSASTLLPLESVPIDSRKIAAIGPLFPSLPGEVFGEERLLALPFLGIFKPSFAATLRRSDPEETCRSFDLGFFGTLRFETMTAEPALPGDQDMGSNSWPSNVSSLGDEMPRGDETVRRGGVDRFLIVGLI